MQGKTAVESPPAPVRLVPPVPPRPAPPPAAPAPSVPLPPAVAERLRGIFKAREELYQGLPPAELATLEAQLQEDAKALRKRYRLLHLERCLVPGGILQALEAFRGQPHTPEMRAALKWAAGPAPALLLWGSMGRTKSTAAALTLMHATATKYQRVHSLAPRATAYQALDWKRGLFLSAVELSTLPEQEWQGTTRTTRQGYRRLLCMETLRTVPWLVLDDVGTGDKEVHPKLELRLQELLLHRLDGNLRTVITTNLHLELFHQWVGDARVEDRLTAVGQQRECTGPSLRRPLPPP
jgi:hypothetical protein